MIKKETLRIKVFKVTNSSNERVFRAMVNNDKDVWRTINLVDTNNADLRHFAFNLFCYIRLQIKLPDNKASYRIFFIPPCGGTCIEYNKNQTLLLYSTLTEKEILDFWRTFSAYIKL